MGAEVGRQEQGRFFFSLLVGASYGKKRGSSVTPDRGRNAPDVKYAALRHLGKTVVGT